MSFHALFVLMIPRQLEVVGAAILLRVPPSELQRSQIGVVFALALFGLLWTILAVRPVHAALSEVGNTTALLARLSFVDTVRLVTEAIRALTRLPWPHLNLTLPLLLKIGRLQKLQYLPGVSHYLASRALKSHNMWCFHA